VLTGGEGWASTIMDHVAADEPVQQEDALIRYPSAAEELSVPPHFEGRFKPKSATNALVSTRLPSALLLGVIVGGLIVGIALCLLALLDVTAAGNGIGLAVAVLGHGAVAIIAVGLILELRSDPLKKLIWYVAGIILLGIVLYKIDEFVVRTSPIAVQSKCAYMVLAVLVFLGAALAMPLYLRKDKKKRETLVRAAALGVCFLTVGAALPTVSVAWMAAHRQYQSGRTALYVPHVANIAGRYVALGDSYSAGEGLRPFQPGSPGGCDRSPYAYPLLLTLSKDVQIDFRACSGAVTSDIDLGITGGYPAQIDLLPQPDVSLVTISVGGNDVIFSDVVKACFIFNDCISAKFTPRAEKPSRPSVKYPAPQPFATWAPLAIDMLIAKLSRVYDRLQEAYPKARFVVIGYPYLFPDGDPPSNLSDCAVVLRRVNKHERHEIRRLMDVLNDKIYMATLGHGFDFVSHHVVARTSTPTRCSQCCGSFSQSIRARSTRTGTVKSSSLVSSRVI
jgi:lysophospholipase L1-like esterase